VDGAEEGGGGAAGFGVVVVELFGRVVRRVEEAGEGLAGVGLHAGHGEDAVGTDVRSDVGAGAEDHDVQRRGLNGAGSGQRVEVVEQQRGEGGAVAV